ARGPRAEVGLRKGLRVHRLAGPGEEGEGGRREQGRLRAPKERGGQHSHEPDQPQRGMSGPLQGGGAGQAAVRARGRNARDGRQAPANPRGCDDTGGEEEELLRLGG
ncbi:unnamed protein product, partial [Prorocentrum cordatum]